MIGSKTKVRYTFTLTAYSLSRTAFNRNDFEDATLNNQRMYARALGNCCHRTTFKCQKGRICPSNNRHKMKKNFFFVVVVIATHWCYCSYILAFFRPFKCEISNETSDSGKVIAEILHQQQSNVYSPTTTTITNNNKNNNNNGEPKRKHEITIRNHSEEFTRYSNFKSFWPRVS